MARHVPHLLVPGPWTEATLSLSHDHERHLTKVLRLDAGAALSYTDGAGVIGDGTFDHGAIVRGEERRVDRPTETRIGVAPTKSNDRNRFIVEKLAELGASELIWLTTDHGQGRVPKPEKSDAWASGALEQSRGAWRLEISGPVPVGKVQRPQLCVPDGSARFEPGSVLCIGPEGGWSDAEFQAAPHTAGLPFPILRTETAAIVAAALAITSASARQ